MASARREAWAGHGESGGDAFAGDIAQGDSQFTLGEGEKIVVVAADAEGGAAASKIIEAGDFGKALGEETLLNFAGDFDFAV